MYLSGTSSSIFTSAVTTVFLLVGSWHHGVMSEHAVHQHQQQQQQLSAIATNEVGVSSGNNGNVQQTSFVSSSGSGGGGASVGPTAASIPVGNDEQYRATYFYPVPHRVNWNRDTYADAASEFGYNQQQQQATQQGSATASGPVYSPAYGGGDSEGYEDPYGSSLGGLGGLGGVAGILGIKGIKGLGLLGLAKAAIPILAIVLPALLLLPLIFLFFPVPVITVPATGSRSLSLPTLNLGEKMSTLARSVLESDKCVERISCEVSRVSRGSFLDKTLKRVIPRFEPHMPQALKRIARVYMEGPPGSSCSKKYTCYLMDDSGSSAAAKKATSS